MYLLDAQGRLLMRGEPAVATRLTYGLTLVSADRAFERLKLRRENWKG